MVPELSVLSSEGLDSDHCYTEDTELVGSKSLSETHHSIYLRSQKVWLKRGHVWATSLWEIVSKFALCYLRTSLPKAITILTTCTVCSLHCSQHDPPSEGQNTVCCEGGALSHQLIEGNRLFDKLFAFTSTGHWVILPRHHFRATLLGQLCSAGFGWRQQLLSVCDSSFCRPWRHRHCSEVLPKHSRCRTCEVCGFLSSLTVMSHLSRFAVTPILCRVNQERISQQSKHPKQPVPH